MTHGDDTDARPPALHRMIVVTDVVGFSAPHRTPHDQDTIRRHLKPVTQDAFHRTDIHWAECRYGDRGDGALILVSPAFPKAYFATRLPRELAASIARYNSRQPPGARFRVRMALHAGEVTIDDDGVSGPAVIQASRLLEAPTFKEEAATRTEIVNLIVSSWYFDEVIGQLPARAAEKYHRIHDRVKSTIVTGWVRFVDSPLPRSVPDDKAVVHRLSHLPQAPRTAGERRRSRAGRHRLRRGQHRHQIIRSAPVSRPRWPLAGFFRWLYRKWGSAPSDLDGWPVRDISATPGKALPRIDRSA